MGSSGPLGSLYAVEAVEKPSRSDALIVCCDLIHSLGVDCGALRLIEGMDPIGTTTRQQVLRAGYLLLLFTQFDL